MYPLPWYVILFQSFPETFLMIILGFKLFNLNIELKKVTIISLIVCVFAYFVRHLPLAFGVHTLILVLIDAILCRAIGNIKLVYGLIGITVGALINGVLQSLLVPIMLSIGGMGISALSSEPVLNIVLFLPIGIIMLALCMVIKKCNFVLYDLSIHGK
ncbi:hypothetical protein V6C27_05935 [Peptococcaceae bacterium 1198_IL3148]